MFTSRRYNTTATQHAVSSVVQPPTTRHRRVDCETRRREYQDVYGAVLICVRVLDEANNKLVRLAREHSIFTTGENLVIQEKDKTD